MKISVGVITYEREAMLAECLQSLASQSRLPDEVIIIDNGSKRAHNDTIIRQFSDALPIHYVYVSARKVSAARNEYLTRATGDILAFTDDDCILDERWLEKLTEPFLSDPHIGQTGGFVDKPDKKLNMYEQCAHELSMHLQRLYQAGLHEVESNFPYICFFQTSNTAYRRAVFDDIGLFDPAFQTTEDIDISVRLVNHGWKIHFAKDAIVYHYHRSTFNGLISQRARWGRDRILLFKKHDARPRRLTVMWFTDPVVVDDGGIIAKRNYRTFPFFCSGFINIHAYALIFFRKLLLATLVCIALLLFTPPWWTLLFVVLILAMLERFYIRIVMREITSLGIAYPFLRALALLSDSITSCVVGCKHGILMIH